MLNFTKDVWQLEDKNREVCCTRKNIAYIYHEGGNVPYEEAEANAQLIVYAPKMYKMLCRLAKEVSDTGIKGDIISLLQDINDLDL